MEPPQAVQLEPHAVSDLHTEHAPETHCWFVAHELGEHMHAPTPQSGVTPLHATHDGPQWAGRLQFSQAPALHHRPLPQSASTAQSVQAVPAALQIRPAAAQSVHAEPQ